MVFMLSGMTIDVMPLHPPNARLAIDVTLLGITVLLQPAINVFVAFSIIALQLSRES